MTNNRVALALADALWLMEPDQQELLAQLADDDRPLLGLLAHLRDRVDPDQARRLVEQRELRQRATNKFTAASRMLFTRTGYEQATDEWIAHYKVARFAGLPSAADLCSGIGGDTAAMAQVVGQLVACDRDPGILALAEHNVKVQTVPEVAECVEWRCGDVREVPIEELSAWHIDPDRRAAGGRSTHTAVHDPSDEVIDQLLALNPNAAVKLAPACEAPTHWQESSELEWISRGGECRQLVVWHGGLTESPGMRRATAIPAAGGTPLGSVAGVPAEAPCDQSIGDYCYECDPALLAADLTGEVARELGLWQFAVTHGYLTGASRHDHALLKGYAVDEVLPMQVKRVAAALRAQGIGRLAIKHRGVKLDPEGLLKRLKPSGDREGVLVVTRQGDRQIALVCSRLEPLG